MQCLHPYIGSVYNSFYDEHWLRFGQLDSRTDQEEEEVQSYEEPHESASAELDHGKKNPTSAFV
jgi:hypothetical protein